MYNLHVCFDIYFWKNICRRTANNARPEPGHQIHFVYQNYFQMFLFRCDLIWALFSYNFGQFHFLAVYFPFRSTCLTTRTINKQREENNNENDDEYWITYHVPVIGPATELHVTMLIVKWKPCYIDFTCWFENACDGLRWYTKWIWRGKEEKKNRTQSNDWMNIQFYSINLKIYTKIIYHIVNILSANIIKWDANY